MSQRMHVWTLSERANEKSSITKEEKKKLSTTPLRIKVGMENLLMLAIPYTKEMDERAPKKAKTGNHLELKLKMIPKVAPKAAPPETPRVYGSANGLRNNP
jgi:hypothetical protein